MLSCSVVDTLSTGVDGGNPSKHLAGETQETEKMSKQGSGTRCQVGERL